MMNIERDTPITITCEHCGKEKTIWVNELDFCDFALGDILVQEAFPYLTPAEREMFISQTCEECWDRMFEDIKDFDFVTVGKGVE